MLQRAQSLSIDSICPEPLKTPQAFDGTTAWHTENVLRLAPVLGDRTARRASG